jgi:hypothetical protein
VEKAVEYAGQILDALEAAHRQGITHRDLKPANILVTKQGIKLLDFGLATRDPRVGRGFSRAGDGAAETTLSPIVTAEGQIVGTLQYMAPEQLQGQPADARSDIFAFGCVLYELLSGTRAFDGASAASVIAAILERQPVPIEQHPPLDRIIATCLAKDPDARFQNARDLKRALMWAMEPVAGSVAASTAVAWWQRPIVIAALSIATLTIGAFSAGLFRASPSPESAITSRFELPVNASYPVWSADGRQLAWIEQDWTLNRGDRVVVRRLDEFQSRTVVEGEGRKSLVAFSPDGQWLAHSYGPGVGFAPTEIRKVPVSGGPSERIAAVPSSEGAGLSSLLWDGDRVLLAWGRELLEAPAAGGMFRPVFALPEGHVISAAMQIINGGRDLIFVGGPLPRGLWTVPMAGGAPRRVLEKVMSFRVTESGHLLHSHASETHLFGRPFREDTIEVLGDPVPLLEMSYRGMHAFGVSPNGSLAYQPGEQGRDEPVWLDRASGRVDPIQANLPSTSPFFSIDSLQLSPDGQFLVYLETALGLGAPPLRVWDLTRQKGFKVSDGASNFSIAARTNTLLFSKVIQDGRLLRNRLFRVEFPWTAVPTQVAEWSQRFLTAVFPDARRVMLGSPLTGEFTWVANADGSGEPLSVERWASPSPDGRWVAYVQGSVAPFELWVRPEPAAANKKWLLAGGVRTYFWSGDGRELFYTDEKEQWHAVTVRGPSSDAPFALGRPLAVKAPENVSLRALAPDGTRFLAIRKHRSTTPDRLAIVQNFFEELRAKVPVK